MWISGTQSKRNHQVQQMGDLYRQATLVISWLGEEIPACDAFFRSLHDLGYKLESTPVDRHQCTFDTWLLHTFEQSTAESSKLQRGNFVGSLMGLVTEKLFRRGWVFQEAVLASSNSNAYLCQDEAIDIQYFFPAIQKLNELYTTAMFRPSFISVTAWRGLMVLKDELRRLGSISESRSRVSSSQRTYLLQILDQKICNESTR